MCGRIAQYNHPLRYTEFLGIENAALMFDRADQRLGFNVAPGCHPVVVFPDGSLRRIHWGYRPPWAAERGLPHTLNARVESAAEQPYFRSLWRHGRVIVPVDGWYEWRIELGRKQAYYIRLQADAPMFVAALTNFQEGKVCVDDVGLVIVTAASDTGLIDVHDRRPLVLSTADAWRISPTVASQGEIWIMLMHRTASNWPIAQSAVASRSSAGSTLTRPSEVAQASMLARASGFGSLGWNVTAGRAAAR